jgi:hypothetical protein
MPRDDHGVVRNSRARVESSSPAGQLAAVEALFLIPKVEVVELAAEAGRIEDGGRPEASCAWN